jgi:hypothetical protein
MSNPLVRVGLPVVAVVALVFGVTYVSQVAPNTGPPKPVTPGRAKAIAAPSLIVPTERASWDLNEPPEMPTFARHGKEMEPGAAGHYDFWVANIHDVPANIQLMATSCKCADVQLGIVDASAVAAFLNEQSPAIPQPVEPAAVEKLLAVAAKNPTLIQKVEWQPLPKFDPNSRVPAADPKTGLRIAIVRLDFHPKDQGRLLITATISHVGGGDGKVAQRVFEVPVTIVPAVMMYPDAASVGEIRAGDTRQVEFVLWSATRDSFPIKLPDLPEDPTYVFSKPEPLDATGVVNELRRMKATRASSKPKTGYKVALTIHESLNDKLLELGPLVRRLNFNAGTEYESTCDVKGTVIGDVRLIDATGNNADRIKLGEFEANRPTSKTYNLQAHQPGMKFQVVSVTPAALKVELKEKSAAGQLWELKVEVPKDSIAGPLPPGSSVVLETVGQKSRRVRVPVEGNAMIR